MFFVSVMKYRHVSPPSGKWIRFCSTSLWSCPLLFQKMCLYWLVFSTHLCQIQMKPAAWKRPNFLPLKLLDEDATLAALTWHPVVSDWRPSSWANGAQHPVWSARALFPHPDRTVWNIKAKPEKTSIISEVSWVSPLVTAALSWQGPLE